MALPDIAWFRAFLEESRAVEETDPAPILAWLEERRLKARFSARLIGLAELDGWSAEAGSGNIVHRSGQFFAVEGVRVEAHGSREVARWDQPILTQKEGGVLAMVCRQEGARVLFLLQGKMEPGNLGTVQLVPSIQCTWSNLNRAHQGRLPPLAEVIVGPAPGRLVYAAEHNEEGGRFWRKSNSNRVILVEEGGLDGLTFERDAFVWATLSQIKALALVDNVLSPFVKTIIAPL